MTEQSRRQFIGLTLGTLVTFELVDLFFGGRDDKPAPMIPKGVPLHVEKSFDYNGLQFEFKGWDLYIRSAELSKISTDQRLSKIIVHADFESEWSPTELPLFPDGPIICRTDSGSAYATSANDIVIKFLPSPEKKEIQFTIYFENKSGRPIDVQHFSYAPQVYTFDNNSILSEKHISKSLVNEIREVKKLWSEIAPLPKIYLLNWANNIEYNVADYRSKRDSSKDGLECITLVISDRRQGIDSKTDFAATMYHEFGHWLYESILDQKYVDVIDAAYKKLGGPEDLDSFAPFSEVTFNLGGGHPQDEPTELCASICALLRSSPAYRRSIQNLPESFQTIHFDLTQAIFQGIADASNLKTLEHLFPNFRALLK